MKPLLVIGLGNALVGDDGIGCRVVESLACDQGLRRRADFVVGGSDLLRWDELMEGRQRVVVIDALLSRGAPGAVAVYEEPFADIDDRWGHAHLPSAVQAVKLLKAVTPALRGTTFTLIGIAVPELRHEATLSAKVPEIADRIRRAIRSLDHGGGEPLSRSAGAARR
ncbi:MAG: hydrogenase maturation protease [Gemmatimonadota bacterium]|nr:hydrogenase maturation protease [Gemmatimonadota bacterium]